MTTIKSIMDQFASQYINHNAVKMPVVQRKAISAICSCRSEQLGIVLFECNKCHKQHAIFRSCGNRHCPNCQHHKQYQWLNKRIERQLPGHHFMVTFTIPKPLRKFIYRHQRIAYDAMFKASAGAIKKLAADDKYIGGDLPGFFGALHTWGSQLQYHPHIHYVVAGGALCKAGKKWLPSRIDFFLPVRALSKIFKAKFRALMIQKGLYGQIPQNVWGLGFNVDCRPVAGGQRSVTYLSRYLFKVAIADSRLVKIEDNRVFFKYRVKNSNRLRTTSLSVMMFIGRFLMHVLPKGFVKVRHFGLYSPNCALPQKIIARLIELAFGFDLASDKPTTKELPIFGCPHCKHGTLAFLRIILPLQMGRSGVG